MLKFKKRNKKSKYPYLIWQVQLDQRNHMHMFKEWSVGLEQIPNT
jgi:hypothetical protein